jgi:hypothetical protein
MGVNVIPAPSAGKIAFKTSLTSGTSWTVPTGVTSVNVLCVAGGGGGGGSSISNNGTSGGAGGTTSFTGATSASGGNGGLNFNRGSYANNPAQEITGTSGLNNTGYAGKAGFQTGTGDQAQMPWALASNGTDGGQVYSIVSTTPGASIDYAIGAGGTAGSKGSTGANGGAGGSGRIDLEWFA